MEKERILAEIKRTAQENGGLALGAERFEEVTRIGRGVWRGKYWRTWSDAVVEAGFPANQPFEAHSREALMEGLAALTRRHRRFPTYADVRIEKQRDPAFPTHHAFNKIGDQPTRIALLRAYASEHTEHRDILDLLPKDDGADASGSDELIEGSVYMVKSGKHYKIGKTFDLGRRHREIAIELPEALERVHEIRSDDPSGIEAYWHRRFSAKRLNGEWFALGRDDIRAFKRRKFM